MQIQSKGVLPNIVTALPFIWDNEKSGHGLVPFIVSLG